MAIFGSGLAGAAEGAYDGAVVGGKGVEEVMFGQSLKFGGVRCRGNGRQEIGRGWCKMPGQPLAAPASNPILIIGVSFKPL